MRTSPRSSICCSMPAARRLAWASSRSPSRSASRPAWPVDLGAELQRLARAIPDDRRAHAAPGQQAQARDGFAVEQMGIDARDLGRGVGTQAERTARELVDQLEGLQVNASPVPVSSDSRCSIIGGMTSS